MFARQNRGMAAASTLATKRPRRRAARLLQALPLAAALLAGAAALPQPASAATAASGPSWTKLTLINGWGTYPGSAAPAVTEVSGIVYFKGAISTSSTNTNIVPFVLPPAFRPAKNVDVPVDMCDATGGELNVEPSGVTQEIPGEGNSSATCFTSLEGVSFAQSPTSFTPITLKSGWKNFSSLYSHPAARTISGIVHLKGQIITKGTNPNAFTLPPAFRPSKPVYVQINLCTAGIGRLDITPSGAVTVETEGTNNWWMAQCAVSLDGASYALSAKSFTALTLQNGWMNAPYGTAKAAARTISGIVHLEGAVSTTGTNADPFVLPAAFRPATEMFVPVDLCDGNNGRLNILPNGVVSVEAQDDFGEAQCLTSLDGATFAP